MTFPDWALPFLELHSRLVWQQLAGHPQGRFYRHILSGMTVIVSGRIEVDGKPWLHVSFAHGNRLPSWEELRLVKDSFIGRSKQAIQVLPVEAKHVNFNPYCLHLWHCASLRGDGLPDFTYGLPEGLL